MVAGDQYHEAYRQSHRKGDRESTGRNENERKSGSESETLEGRACNRKAKTVESIES